MDTTCLMHASYSLWNVLSALPSISSINTFNEPDSLSLSYSLSYYNIESMIHTCWCESPVRNTLLGLWCTPLLCSECPYVECTIYWHYFVWGSDLDLCSDLVSSIDLGFCKLVAFTCMIQWPCHALSLTLWGGHLVPHIDLDLFDVVTLCHTLSLCCVVTLTCFS